MKKIILGLGFALLASASLMSCSKGEYSSGDLQTGKNPFADANKPKPTPTGTFTAKVNGSDFSAKSAYAYYAEINSVKIFHIVGFKTSLKEADGIFCFTSSKDKGNYAIDLVGGSVNAGTYTATGSTTSVFGETGNIEITESTDTKVKGKFNFKGAGGIEITDGAFDLPVINYSEYYPK
jgi:hypothetical protein